MSTISADNIQPSAGGTPRNAVRGIAAAWANLNGTGTIALRDSENVSSVVDNGNGDYTFNFSNAMANANYKAGCTPHAAGFGVHATASPRNSTAAFAAASLRTEARNATDLLDLTMLVDTHGDLA